MIDHIIKADTMTADVLRLLERGWTSPLKALQEANCLSLSQRAGGFIRAGIPIEKRWCKLPSGKQVREYRVAKSDTLDHDGGCYFATMGERDREALGGKA